MPGLRAIWFGHASVYLEIDGVRSWSIRCSDYAFPLVGIGPQRFHLPPLALELLPKMDAVVISHDHYDHLDMETIRHLRGLGRISSFRSALVRIWRDGGYLGRNSLNWIGGSQPKYTA